MPSAIDQQHISRAAIEHMFGKRIAARGRALHDGGQVLAIVWMESVEMLRALVQGSEPEPYELVVELQDGQPVDSTCSCPYATICKHGAAALMLLADHLQGRPTGRTVVYDESELSSSLASEDSAGEEQARDHPGGRPIHHNERSDRQLRQQQSAWINEYDQARTTIDSSASDHLAGYQDQVWLYRIENTVDGVTLAVLKSKRQKNGSLSKGSLFRIGRDYSYDRGRFTELDHDIHALCEGLIRRGTAYYFEHKGIHVLEGSLGALLLDLVVRTGRGWLGNDRTQPLTTGPECNLELQWVDVEGDGQAPARVLNLSVADRPQAWRLPTSPPRYLDPASHEVGPLLSTLEPSEIELLATMPPLPQAHAKHFAIEMASQLNDPGFPPPAEVSLPSVITDAKPVMLLYSPQENPHVDGWALVPLVQYDDYTFGIDPYAVDVEPLVWELVERTDAETVRVQRNLTRERELLDEFTNLAPAFRPCRHLGLHGFDFADHRPHFREPEQCFKAFQAIVAAKESLEASGWHLIVSEPVDTRVVKVFNLQANLNAGAAGWFDLALGVTHEGVRYDLLNVVLDWLEQDQHGDTFLTRTDAGEWLEVPSALLKPIAETIADLGTPGKRGIRLSRARALSLKTLSDELHDANVETQWQGGDDVFQLAESLAAMASVSGLSASGKRRGTRVKKPKGLKATLRPYQLAGLGWLDLLAAHELNGVLADDMGLGKTLQTLAHIQSQYNGGALKGPVLIVAPTSVLGNWAREAERFVPTLSVRVWHGGDRHSTPLKKEKASIIITSYALSLRDADVLAKRRFSMLVLDEAQMIKNPQAKISQAVRKLPIKRRLCLTGTPLENHLGELWSLFDFLMPGLLGDRTEFTRHYRTPIEKHGDTNRQRRLVNAISPFLLRRRKEEVAADLPPKTEIIREVALDGQQAALYETIRVAMQKRVRKLLQERGFERSRIEMLDALLKLRQTCCHPALLKTPAGRRVTTSAKTILALDMIDELVTEGRKLLVFSQFTEMLAILETGLDERGINYVKLTGRTRKRDQVIDAFQLGDVPVFLISLKAGGTGLNLTAADTVIHYDPWWNPAVERQASDRAHRIGQKKPVFVYKLVATGTVEERIVAMQAEKQALSDATIERSGEAMSAGFSADDVLSLFDQVSPDKA